jgi:HEAT repeat protein
MQGKLLILPLLCCVLLGGSIASAREPLGPVPPAAKVSLHFSADRFRIGDNIQMIFRLENSGGEPFSYNYGGDYRGTGFPLRCKVVVKNSRGKTMPDLAQNAPNMGGLGATPKLKPGETFDQALPLLGYVAIDEPDVYTISVMHDFGWTETARRKFPVATATIVIMKPTLEEAEARVDELLKARPDVLDDKTGDAQYRIDTQLRRLRHPVFLGALAEQANSGNAAALVGVANIETVASTEVIVRLLGHESSAVASAAADALFPRIPPRSVNGHQVALRFYPGRKPDYLPGKSWEPRFADPVHAQARQFLVSKDALLVARGASLMTVFGKEQDMPLIRQALLDELGYRPPRSLPQDNILDEPGSIKPLLSAVDALRERGFRTEGTGDIADLVIYFRQLADPAIARPSAEKWQQSLQAFISQNPATLRENAVRALPLPITEEWRPYLLKALEDEDRGVILAACEMAGKSGDSGFIKPLAQIVEVERHPWVRRAASNAAWTLGARFEIWEAWTERLIDKETADDAFQALQYVIQEVDSQQIKGSGSDMNVAREDLFELRARWRDFLHTHRDDLISGKRFSYLDPAIKPLMVSANGVRIFSLSLPDGTMWPER